MVDVLYPEETKVQGNTSVTVAAAVDDMAAPKLATEINAVTSVNVSCFLADFNAAVTLNSGSSPARLCTTIQLPAEGLAQYQPIELRYVYDPQEDDDDDNNQAKATLTESSTVFLIVRKGLDARVTDYAATQQCEVWKVRLGAQTRQRSGDDEFAVYQIVQNAYPTVVPEFDAVIAA